MRMIKFRVWDIQNKNFVKDSLLENINSYFTAADGTISWFRNNNEYIIQQFTGLKDVDGVDIYEGDIVEYTQHMFNTDAVRTERKEIKWIEYLASFNVYETAAGQSGHKVVGNIFEDQNNDI